MGNMETSKTFNIADMAHIARLRLDENEAQQLEKDLKGILAYFSDLQKFNGKVAEGKAAKATPRKDEVKECCVDAKDISKLFNHKEGGYMMVPKSLED
ncbi:Asp-tRNA(Asn)/Glu-tRNA(Gln) amidotransferase GatCAB subunit C [Candidatus Micrarchaeota archaeon CG08_land_8_20_14_0_20_49_17]|nr:MAG: hypothetical protein AUJ13_02630 [Candidatus Micrarchaeota archaeon CG1_02_49_24]PIU10027.1 MAG: Asp-tRNA(Asn)/Glu-tRNA(Gln) amidotransferase GatCAB subunit C [Candidatus Micrarchaeota archaeon CG08_land_8_20_14_0_20_49_17]PIZ99601.1 MAG: Asp-tRNA(Asn)/Glu-tRNA(Gln) amidotransferase GatCAB subunit C [Candidatus Micrarchaeota archaeon CG_4_10_14_0_2_um_filter_49_7]HII53476.1 Asp-tRNA(Asn)/Glu-tRNA(Gln) amidotransferase subunit GatC [Candidatus Micrarchaeota archaeon]